jgi:molybdopterin converting factor small subunit
MSEPIQYVSKATFDEVYAELKALKASPPTMTIASFNDVYSVDKLQAQVAALEAKCAELEAGVPQPDYTYSALFTENEKAMSAKIESLTKQLEEWKHGANYWAIENDTNYARWDRAMADGDRYRKAAQSLIAYGNMLAVKTGSFACAKHYQTELANWRNASEEARKNV